jgi:hypothetical protein
LFWVGIDNTIQGQVIAVGGLSENTRSDSSINALNLKVSDPPFLRICEADSAEYEYSEGAYYFYLYYTASDGSLKKYGFFESNKSWVDLGYDFPSDIADGVVEAQFDSGIESLWGRNSMGVLEQWWRYSNWSNVNSTEWTLGMYL